MKKIIAILVLTILTVSCELFDPNVWEEHQKDREERGVNCYRRYNGTFYCKDKYGNELWYPSLKNFPIKYDLWRERKRLFERREFIVF